MFQSRAIAGKPLVVGVLVLLGLIFFKPTLVAAHGSHQTTRHTTQSQTTPVPAAPADDTIANNAANVTISPTCYSEAFATAWWEVTNPNDTSVNVTWSAQDSDGNPFTGNYHAPAGTTTFQTYYGSETASVDFTSNGDTTTLAMPTEACATEPTSTPTETCVDGSVKDNLVVTWQADDTVSVHTVDYAPLCSDVTVYFSSYILPANYNGQGFGGNPTSYPQNIYSSVSGVLSAGTDGSQTLGLNLPDSCNNTQVDVYYAPELTIIGAAGHSNQYISGYIIPSTGTCKPTCPPTVPKKHCPPVKKHCPPCPSTPPCPTTPPEQPPVDTPTTPSGSTGDTTGTGGFGAGPTDTAPTNIPETPVVTAAAVVATPATATAAPAAATLTDTGINTAVISLIALSLLAAASATVRRRTTASSK